MFKSILRLTSSRRYASFETVSLNYKKWLATNATENLAPLVMLHGLLGNMDNVQRAATRLAARGPRNVYTIDMRNHGGSSHSSEHTSGHVAADVAALLRKLKLPQILAFGHSSGGRGMMTLALTQPELVDRLIVADISPLRLPSNIADLQAILKLIIETPLARDQTLGAGRQFMYRELVKLTHSKGLSQLILKNLVKLQNGKFHWMINAKALMKNWHDFTHYHETIAHLEPYKGPVLLLAGTKSQFVLPEEVESIKRYFPNMRVEWMNAGHLLHVDQPEQFIKIMLDFCN